MKQNKKLLSILLILVLLFSLVSTALAEPAPGEEPAEEPTEEPAPGEEPAEEPTEEPAPGEESKEEPSEEPVTSYFVIVGGIHVNSKNAADVLGDGTVSFDPETKTLTFTTSTPAFPGEYEGRLIYTAYDLTINVPAGGLKLDGSAVPYELKSLVAGNGNLTVNGNLDIYNPKGRGLYCEKQLVVNGSVKAICAQWPIISWSGDILVTGDVDVTATGEQNAVIYTPGNIEIRGSTKVKSTGKMRHLIWSASGSITLNSSVDVSNGDGYGLFASQSITVNGSVTGTCFYSPLYAYNGSILVTGDVDVTSTGDGAYNIHGQEAIEIRGSAKVKTTGKTGLGLYSRGTVTMQSGVWDIEGTTHAFWAEGGIVIPDTHAITTPARGTFAMLGGAYTVTEADGTTVATHAVIEPKPVYTVSFDANGGDGAMDNAVVSYGEQYTLPGCGFTAPLGKEFDAWDAGKPGDKIDVMADMTVKAIWKPITYTVSFDANGGDGAMADATVSYGEQFTLPDCGFTAPQGMEFDTWDAGKPGDKIDVTGNRTIKAVWKPLTFTVKFEMNGGDAIPDQAVEYGKTAAKPTDPIREGYEFLGWFADAELNQSFDFTAPIQGDTTVYAKWEQIRYTVTGGGNSTWSKGSKTGVTITVAREPKPETCFSHFTGLEIDGVTLKNGTDYEAREGSTVITIKPAALEKLKSGSRSVIVHFDDGQAETKIIIKAGSGAPGTGDESRPGLWLALLILSGAGLSTMALTPRKRRGEI